MSIPSQILDYRVYNNTTASGKGKQLVGVGDEVKLPTLASLTAEVDLPDGKVDVPGMRTENMELEIPFNTFDDEAASLMNLTKTTHLTLYGAQQRVNQTSHDFDNQGLRVDVKGFVKELDIGTLKRSDKMDSKITLTLTYIRVDKINAAGAVEQTYLEVDKLNSVFILNGVDVRAGIDKFL